MIFPDFQKSQAFRAVGFCAKIRKLQYSKAVYGHYTMFLRFFNDFHIQASAKIHLRIHRIFVTLIADMEIEPFGMRFFMSETIDYYNQNADSFAAGTQNADMSDHYRIFLPYLLPGSKLLDLGCGSGRDSAFFASMGFDVTAVDGSAVLCQRVRERYGIEAQCMKFDELAFSAEFDAVWACASLLHVQKADMSAILCKVSASLKPGGILYASYKYGSEERICKGRLFSDYTERDIDTLLTKKTQLSLLEYWITEDVRPDHVGERWLNLIARKEALS